MTLAAGLRLAVGTLTVLPSGPVVIDRPTARSAMLLAPLAVAPLALGAVILAAGVEVGLPPFVAAVLVLTLLAAGTRALHLDGLADLTDALGGGWSAERAREILRRGDVGPMGVAAIVLVLALQATSLAALLDHGWRAGLVVAAAVVLSRGACALLCQGGTVVAPGSSMGATFVGSVPVAAAVVPALLGGVALALAGSLVVDLPRAAAGALAAVAAVVATSWWVRRRATARLGGVGGDAIGAGVELSLAAVLLVLAWGW